MDVLTVQWRCRSSTARHAPLSSVRCDTEDQEDEQTARESTADREPHRRTLASTQSRGHGAAAGPQRRRDAGDVDDVSLSRQVEPLSSRDAADDDRVQRDRISTVPVKLSIEIN